jgi:hypothetical protein
MKLCLSIVAICFYAAGAVAYGLPQEPGAKYQVVKVCSLLSLAEVKKLAPWAPHLDQFAKPEEEPIGSTGSSCNYPTVFIQVMAFQRSFIDAARKTEIPLEPVSGVGDEAYVRNNRGNYAELVAKVGPHSLTVQLSIDRNKTFESTKPSLIEIGKAYAAKLR